MQRAFRVLEAMIAGDGRVESVAEELGLPISTAYRQVTALVAEGCLVRNTGGRHAPGPRLLALLTQIDPKQIIADVARPTLERLARDLQTIVQLGTLEQGMVTYRIKAGRGSTSAFTRVGMQMEAYCSAVGKVLLAHLPEDELDAYLTSGPLVPLTASTITDTERLREELLLVGVNGYAIDDNEAADGLYCVAMPLAVPAGSVSAAISVSRTSAVASAQGNAMVIAKLGHAVKAIECELA